jgi:hypothetical protein
MVETTKTIGKPKKNSALSLRKTYGKRRVTISINLIQELTVYLKVEP